MEDDFPFSVYLSALNQLPPAGDDDAFNDTNNRYPSRYPPDVPSQGYLGPSAPFAANPLATSFTDAALQNELNLWTNAQFKFDIPLLSENADLKSSNTAVESALADVYLNLQDSPVPVPYTNGKTSLSSIPPMSHAATYGARIPVDQTRKRTRSLNSNSPKSALFSGNDSASLIPDIPYNSIGTHNFTNTNGPSYLYNTAGIPAADVTPPLSHLYGAYPAAVTPHNNRASELLNQINTMPAAYPSRECTAPEGLGQQRPVPLQTNVPSKVSAVNHGHPTAPGATDAAESTGLVEQEDSSITEAHEDKRRRNTAASARFRVKKKQREQALERTAKEMTERVKILESQVAELAMENKWLRGLIVDKDPRLIETVDALKVKARVENLNMSSPPTDEGNGSPSRPPPPTKPHVPTKSSNNSVETSFPTLQPARHHPLYSLSTSQTIPSSTYTHSPVMQRTKRTKPRVSA